MNATLNRRIDRHVTVRELVARVEQRERAGTHTPAELEEQRRVVTWLAKLIEHEERPHG